MTVEFGDKLVEAPPAPELASEENKAIKQTDEKDGWSMKSIVSVSSIYAVILDLFFFGFKSFVKKAEDL